MQWPKILFQSRYVHNEFRMRSSVIKNETPPWLQARVSHRGSWGSIPSQFLSDLWLKEQHSPKWLYFPLSIILSSFYFPIFELICFLVDEWRMQKSKLNLFLKCVKTKFLTQSCLNRLYKLPGHLPEVYVCRLFSAVLSRTFSHAVVYLLHSFFWSCNLLAAFWNVL